jgi:hypothetical protein
MDSCPPRRGGRFRCRRRSAGHRSTRRVRRIMRTGQSAPHQRAVRRIAPARPYWRLPPIYPLQRSVVATFRRPIPTSCSGRAVIIANSSRMRHSSLMCWRTPSARPSGSVASRSSWSPATWRYARRPPAAFRRAGLLPAAPIVRPAEPELEALAKLLNGAQRVTLFCGRGCAGAHSGLMKLAETLKSPMVHALGGKEHVEFDNPYDVGMTGFIGFSSG